MSCELKSAYILIVKLANFMNKKKWGEILNVCVQSEKLLEELKKDKQLMSHCQSLPHFLRKFTSVSILLHSLCYTFEAHQRLKDYKSAITLLEKLLSNRIYLQDYRGRWYDRLALNYDQHLKNPQKALCIIETAMKDPEVRVGYKLALSVRAQRILSAKRTMKLSEIFKSRISFVTYQEAPKIFIQGRTLPSDIPGYKRVFLSLDSSRNETICSVEELAKSYYRKNGYNEGVHCEGQTIKSIFCLLFWDQIYAPVPDAFRSTQQAAPLDMDSSHFYGVRKDIIEERLSQIEEWSDAEICQELKQTWNAHQGTTCMVNWSIFRDVEHMQGLALCLGPKLLIPICRRLCIDHRFTRSGFPDLVLWSPQKKVCRIVEVKGPNDHLSTKQILWLDFLLESGVKAEVCHVEAVGAKRLQCLNPEISLSGSPSSLKKSPKKSPVKTPQKYSPKRSSPKSKPPSKTEPELLDSTQQGMEVSQSRKNDDKHAVTKASRSSKRQICNSEDEFSGTDIATTRTLRKRAKK